MDTSVILGGSVLAAFIAGVIALFTSPASTMLKGSRSPKPPGRSSPGVFIDGHLFSHARVSERMLRRHLRTRGDQQQPSRSSD